MPSTMRIHTSQLQSCAAELRAGMRVSLSGEIYTARDMAHLKLTDLLDNKQPLPFDISGAVIYYAGPTPPAHGRVIGSCGPTTSGRMDAFTPRFYDLGLCATIGKGERSTEVRDAIMRNGSVYFCAVGGAGAILARSVTDVEEIAFPELGCESVKRLFINEMPLFVGIDSHGGEIFNTKH